MNKIIERIFRIMPTNEENNDFVIVVGNHLATDKHFRTKEEAEKYITKPRWELIISTMAEMIEQNENKKTEKA